MCGPSGVGKSSLIKRLQTDFPAKVGFSVSHTTRNPRPGEVDGVDYHFVTREQMLAEIEAGAFIEYAHVHNNIYGTRLDYFCFSLHFFLLCFDEFVWLPHALLFSGSTKQTHKKKLQCARCQGCD
jgi:GTPase SAR1 family protein